MSASTQDAVGGTVHSQIWTSKHRKGSKPSCTQPAQPGGPADLSPGFVFEEETGEGGQPTVLWCWGVQLLVPSLYGVHRVPWRMGHTEPPTKTH